MRGRGCVSQPVTCWLPPLGLLRSVAHLAAISGSTKVLKVLLEEGADKDIANRWGHSPLHVAIMSGNSMAVDLLTKAGAHLTVEDPAASMCTAASEEDVAQVRHAAGRVYNGLTTSVLATAVRRQSRARRCCGIDAMSS